MSRSSHITHLLHDYLDGDLPAPERDAVERHLADCPACRSECDALRGLLAETAALPKRILPRRDLWAGIAARIASPDLTDTPAPDRSPSPHHAPDRQPKRPAVSVRSRTRQSALYGLAALLVLLGGIGIFWFVRHPAGPTWAVVALDGRPRIGREALAGAGRIHEGQWLETDAVSRAQLDVGRIGNVEVGPNTRLQLRRAHAEDHRIAVTQGKIEAFVWAPPRLFFVETPSALAVDLGCAYTLTVDSTGASLLHVTSGYVELVHGEHMTVVPAGAMCLSRPGRGPGTAFDQKASTALRRALTRYDFDGGGAQALSDVLAEARATDAITLWQLFTKAPAETRPPIYDRLVTLVPPPLGVTREGVLRGNATMHDAWASYLSLDPDGWWRSVRSSSGRTKK